MPSSRSKKTCASLPTGEHFNAVIAKFAAYGGYANSNRPVQPLNGRVIQLRCGAGNHR